MFACKPYEKLTIQMKMLIIQRMNMELTDSRSLACNERVSQLVRCYFVFQCGLQTRDQDDSVFQTPISGKSIELKAKEPGKICNPSSEVFYVSYVSWNNIQWDWLNPWIATCILVRSRHHIVVPGNYC